MSTLSENIVADTSFNAGKVLEEVWDNIFENDIPMNEGRALIAERVHTWVHVSAMKKFEPADELPEGVEKDVERISRALRELVDELIRGRMTTRTFLCACRVHALRDWGLELV